MHSCIAALVFLTCEPSQEDISGGKLLSYAYYYHMHKPCGHICASSKGSHLGCEGATGSICAPSTPGVFDLQVFKLPRTLGPKSFGHFELRKGELTSFDS